jgi:hypothetical protein
MQVRDPPDPFFKLKHQSSAPDNSATSDMQGNNRHVTEILYVTIVWVTIVWV